MIKLLCTKRAVLMAAVLGLALMAAPLSAHGVSAGLITCDTDPVVFLSDGTIIDMSAAITDAPSDVQSVVYTVHAPAGVSMLAHFFPRDPLSSLESVVVANDSTSGYTTETTVTTGQPGVSVTAKTLGINLRTGAQGQGSASGLSGQPLSVSLLSQQ